MKKTKQKRDQTLCNVCPWFTIFFACELASSTIMTNVIKTKLQRQKKNNNSFFGLFENHGPVQSLKRKENVRLGYSLQSG